MTHYCSNYSTSIIKSIPLFNSHYLEHCSAWVVFPSILKQRYYFLGRGSFLPGILVLLLCWYCSESYPKMTWALGLLVMWLFLWAFQTTMSHHQQCHFYLSCFCLWDEYRLSLNKISRCILYIRICTRMCILGSLLCTFYINIFIELIMNIWSGWIWVLRIAEDARLHVFLFKPILCAWPILLAMFDE